MGVKKMKLKLKNIKTQAKAADAAPKIVLSDLLTHLLGMGGAAFWITIVMKQVIPHVAATLMEGVEGGDGKLQWCEFLGTYTSKASFGALFGQ